VKIVKMDNMDKIVQQILALMNANADAARKERKDFQERMAADQENWLAKMKVESIDVNQDLLARMEAKMDSNQ
jgi:BMFP domain-containing protein YqiC